MKHYWKIISYAYSNLYINLKNYPLYDTIFMLTNCYLCFNMSERKEENMKTRTVKNFILVLLMVAIILVVTEKLTVYASEDADGSYNSEDYKWTDFRDEWSEEEVLAHQEQAALKDDYNVYYYTIREMVLNDEYDPKILSKKYETMDKYWRFYARLTNDRPFIKAETRFGNLIVEMSYLHLTIILKKGS